MGKYKDLWRRGKDGNYRGQRSFVRCVVVATALALVFLMIKKDNIFTWIGSGATVRAQQEQIRELTFINDSLDARIRDLESDRDSLERYAREQLMLCEPGDDVYLVTE